MHALVPIFFRWLHIVSACIAVGGVFFLRVLVPVGLKELQPEARGAVFLRMRRVFKMVIHTCILSLLVSGIYNSMANWGAYERVPQVAQPLWGTHVLLATIVFAILLYVLMGKEAPAKHGTWMAINLLLMAALIGVAGAVKYVREHHPAPAMPSVVVSAHSE